MRSRGFTLLEVVFTVGVLGLTLLTLVSLVLHVSRSAAEQRQTQLALRAAERRVETLRASGLGTAPPAFDVDGLAPPGSDPDGRCGRIVAEPEGGSRLVPVTVRVDWQGVGGDRSIEIHCLLENR